MKKILLNLSFIIVLLTGCEEIFYVEDISKDTVELITPADNVVFDAQNVSLHWGAIEGAEQYHLEIVSPSFLNSNLLLKDTTLTSITYEVDLAPNKYQWRVKGINSGYETAYSTHSFEIISLNPEDTVELLRPVNALITNNSEQNLKWNAVNYAEKYTVQIWKPDTSGELLQEIQVETTETTINFEEGTFIWQVNAVNKDNSTAYSSRSIVVDSTGPNTPELEIPTDLTETVNNTVDFFWKRVAVSGSSEIDSLFVYKDAANIHAVYKDNVPNGKMQLVLDPNTYYC